METHPQQQFKHIQFSTSGALLAVFLTVLMLQQGITMTSDSWAYWEGSVSILSGNGYEYFGGQDIIVFPPLFSSILSLLQLLIGVNGLSLFYYLTTLASVNAFVWVYLFLRVSKQTKFLPSFVFTIYVSFFTSIYFTTLLAEALALPLFGLSLIVLLRNLDKPDQLVSLRDQLIISSLITALLLTKNSNVSLLIPYFLTLALTGRKQRLKRFRIATIVTVIPVFVWYSIRYCLGQSGSHPMAFSGHYSLQQYIGQLFQGLSMLLGPGIVGSLLLGLSLFIIIGCALNRKDALLSKGSSYQKLYILLLAILSSIVFLFILFNLVWINDSFQGRFIWVLPIVISGALVSLVSINKQPWQRNAIMILLIALTLIQVERSSMHIYHRMQNDSSGGIQFHHSINPNYVTGPAIEQEDYILLSPPEKEWIKR